MRYYVVRYETEDGPWYLSNRTGGRSDLAGARAFADVEQAVGLMFDRTAKWTTSGKLTALAVWEIDGDEERRVFTWGHVARWCRSQLPTHWPRCLGCGREMDCGAMLCHDCGVHVHVGAPLR